MGTGTEATYAADSINILFGGIKISGYADGTYISVKRSSPLYTKKIGADGTGARARQADLSGEIEITLLATSPSNDFLSAQVVLDRNGLGVNGFQMTDKLSPNEICHADRAWVAEMPQTEKDKEVGEKKWVFHTIKLEMFHGGNPVVPIAG